ncbi:hypothetical protein [uncultured Roseobacter sp.]|uniref:hypothetical protein n=1 Tax=uncultured Roseobacter sp. TaxID=114847 RepID=UPI00261A85FF|nr:hypothetical protein [uncultured Roseobacter sp.]
MIERSPVYGKKFDVTLGTKGRAMVRAGALVANFFCASKRSSQASGSGAMGIARRRDAHASLVLSNDFWNRFLPVFSSKALIRRPGGQYFFATGVRAAADYIRNFELGGDPPDCTHGGAGSDASVLFRKGFSFRRNPKPCDKPETTNLEMHFVSRKVTCARHERRS